MATQWSRFERQEVPGAQCRSEALDDFLLSLGHELRTPINAIVGWAHLLSQRTLSPELDEGLHAIERNARRQAKLVDDLLDVNRILAGRLTLVYRPLALERLLARAIDAARPGAEGKGVALLVSLDASSHPVMGDAPRLDQVFAHVLGNAIRYTPRDGCIHVSTRRDGCFALVTVADTGDGIPLERLPYVFERYHAGSGAAAGHRSAGLGMGLGLTKHLVERHGGTVTVHSDGDGAGTTVRIRLPLDDTLQRPCAPAAGRIQPMTGLPTMPPGARRLEGLDVLLVEDDEDSRIVLAEIIRGAGARCDAATSGRDALALLADREGAASGGSGPYDCMVLDLGLPDTDGCELLQRLRLEMGVRGASTPAIALTAFGRAADRERALLAGFDEYSQKPLQPERMIASIAQLARRRMAAAVVATDPAPRTAPGDGPRRRTAA
jgi:CheY-like chemotaxis protein/anti-sigma regulatory factor (Ser/Thr protein kinase)